MAWHSWATNHYHSDAKLPRFEMGGAGGHLMFLPNTHHVVSINTQLIEEGTDWTSWGAERRAGAAWSTMLLPVSDVAHTDLEEIINLGEMIQRRTLSHTWASIHYGVCLTSRSCEVSPDHVKSHQIMWSFTKSCEVSPDHVKSHQIMWSLTRSFEVSPDHVKSHQIIWSLTRSCEVSPDHVKSHQIMWSLTRSCEVSPDHAKSHQIMRSLKVARQGILSLWNLTALLLRCLSNFRTIRHFKLYTSWCRDFTKSGREGSCHLVNRGPV